ncbi:MAG: hypothetical protein Q9227_008490 [Pyrenula ochraceoflavens]
MESYNVTECSNCHRDVSTVSSDGQHVLCTVHNEGGLQEGFDILPLALEEAYFRTYPEERRGHAFLDFCKEGDTDAIIHLMRDEDDGEVEEEIVEGGKTILHYQDSFRETSESGLHIAISNNQPEVAWLLLFLASGLDQEEFPPNVKRAIQEAGVTSKDRNQHPDIRDLEDSRGRRAFDLAANENSPRWAQQMERHLRASSQR